MSAHLCLASCPLPLDPELCRWWKALRAELGHRGLDLVILASSRATDPELPVVVLPPSLAGYADSYPSAPPSTGFEEPLAQALASRDRSWARQEGTDLSRFRRGLGVCQHVLRALLDELQPAVVLIWGSSLPQSVVLQHLARQQGRPAWVLEPGPIPGTLAIEMAGQGAHAELNHSFALHRTWAMYHGPDLVDAARRALAQRPPAPGSLQGAAFQAKYNPDGRRIIAAVLQHDEAGGLVPRTYLGSRLHAPGIGSGFELVRELARALAQEPSCRLIVKPHPLDGPAYARWDSGRIRVAPDADLSTLIQAADVVVCLSGTAPFEALIQDRPVVLAGRTALSGKGIAYEARTAAELLPALRLALLGDRRETRSSRAKMLLNFMFQHCTVGLTADAPVGARLADFAAFLAGNALVLDGLSPLADRLAAVAEWIATWQRKGDFVGLDPIEAELDPEADGPLLPDDTTPAAASILPGVYPLEVYRVRSQAAFDEIWRERYARAIAGQEAQLPSRHATLRLPGYCVVCGAETHFTSEFKTGRPAGRGLAADHWRDAQVCHCGLNSRQRAAFHLLADHLGLVRDSDLLCTEPDSPLFKQILNAFPRALASHCQGERPAGPAAPRVQNARRLSFADDSFDCVFSLDLLHHAAEPQAVLREFARCLRPEGRLFLGVPVDLSRAASLLQDASVDSAALRHEFGWDLLDLVRRAGFPDAALHVFSSPAYGYLGLHYTILATHRVRSRATNRKPGHPGDTEIFSVASLRSSPVLGKPAQSLSLEKTAA